MTDLQKNFILPFFEEIQQSLIEYYNFCFNQKALSQQTQIGLISLIHKGKNLNREEVNNWRPITLSNVDYKIIAKLLANRIKNVMDKIIGKQQQGFIKGRNIANIIRGIDDILEYERYKNLNDLLLVIDFKKAFDKINNHYIITVFEKYGFGENFLQWLNTILNNRTSCVKNGGYLSSFFTINCGVKQGCPIAPLLFVLGAEILAQNIIQDDTIKGINTPGSNLQIKIMQFADDTSFFCKSLIDIREILSRLKLFSRFSGLIINKNKCSILSMGNNNHYDNVLEGIEVIERVKIVGIVFERGKAANEIKQNWEGRIEKIKNIIKSWMKRKLTIIGKIQVVKTFLLSQFIYVLQSISLREDILNEINTLLFRFIWKKDSINKKAWERVKRKVICNTKEKGGLEMVNIHDFQTSFLIDWACRLIQDEFEEWKIIPFTFFKPVGGLSIFKSKIKFEEIKGVDNIQSSFWKSVLRAWIENNQPDYDIKPSDTINNNEQIKVQNSVLFIENTIKNNILFIEDVYNNGQFIEFQAYENKVGKNCTNMIDYLALKMGILKVKDKIINEETNKILFRKIEIKKINRKKIYQLIREEEICYCENMWYNRTGQKLHKDTWKNLFKYHKETKLIEIQWKILHNIFPTNILLNRIGIKDTEKCEFCNEKDFVEHMFVNCKRIDRLWENISHKNKQ